MSGSGAQRTRDIRREDRLILALDVPEPDDARRLVELLGDSVRFYKIGLELFMAGGYFELVDWLVERERKVFVDLKFFDVPQTVRSAVSRLVGRGVSFCTVHGNDAILEAAGSVERDDLRILAVTALTSLDRGDLKQLGFDCDVESLVLSRARRALELGCDGVVSSGLEVPALRREFEDRLVVVCPGIRPVDNRTADDQKRVVTVPDAFRRGADYIVIGRPVRGAADPRAAAQAIQQQIAQVFNS
jgi:orotidine-5'-phosphate decarboxylase